MMKKILIVEDVEFIAELLMQLLEDDFQLVVAKDGVDGIRLAEIEKPDLILMDIRLPKMNGYEVTSRIKANPDLRHIPIIAVTANAMSGAEREALAAGCDDFVRKPINEDLLFNKLNYFLNDQSRN